MGEDRSVEDTCWYEVLRIFEWHDKGVVALTLAALSFTGVKPLPLGSWISS